MKDLFGHFVKPGHMPGLLFDTIYTMMEEKFQTVPIETGQLIERDSRLKNFRDFFHKLMPSFVKSSKPIIELHLESGKALRIAAIVPSAEAVRHGGSSIPLPNDKDLS